MGIDGFDRNKTSLTGAIFLSQSQNAAYRTPQCSQSLENNATESLSSHPSWPPPRGGMGRLFSLATLHIRIIVGSGISMKKWVLKSYFIDEISLKNVSDKKVNANAKPKFNRI
jgi:hypothetical protein